MAEVKLLSKEQFRKMQLLQLDMLRELDRVCRENNIKYTIAYGSLLGAVRHKGYIPWDDDADVCMLREEYEKFKKVANQLDQSICYFQDHDTDKEYRWGYGKLRRTGTKYVRVGQEHLKCKTGVFIDIFPMDDVPNSKFMQPIHYFKCFLLRKITYAEVGQYNEDFSSFTRAKYRILAKIDIEKVFKHFNKYTEKSKNDSKNNVRILMLPSVEYKREKEGMPKEWFLDLVEYDFEGIKLYGTKDYDACLKYNYGDYMKLPPENERQGNSPFIECEF